MVCTQADKNIGLHAKVGLARILADEEPMPRGVREFS